MSHLTIARGHIAGFGGVAGHRDRSPAMCPQLFPLVSLLPLRKGFRWPLCARLPDARPQFRPSSEENGGRGRACEALSKNSVTDDDDAAVAAAAAGEAVVIRDAGGELGWTIGYCSAKFLSEMLILGVLLMAERASREKKAALG